ncbi:MAG: ATP-binding cassette domain-containing protein [Thermoplasmata archaeon]
MKGINLKVERGETFGITGPTGSGKTTLCYIVAGIVPRKVDIPEGEASIYLRGSITIMGKKSLWISRAGKREKIRISHIPDGRIGLVRQDPDSHFTGIPAITEIKENLRKMGLDRGEIERRLRRALELVKMDSVSLEDLDIPPMKLSAGEKQRIAIAGCLAMKPDVLILDEPASDLDPASRRQVIDAISYLKETEKITIILVEQDQEVLRELADRVAVMNRGEIVAVGPPEEIFSRDDLKHYFLSPDLAEIMGTGKEIEDRINKESLIGFKVRRSRLGRGSVVLETENLRYSYEDGTKAVDGVSLKVRKGEFLALIGANGSGKSTFSRIISGKLSGWSGSIRIKGKDATRKRDLFNLVGYVHQNPDQQVLGGHVLDVMHSGNRGSTALDEASYEKAIEALAKVNLRDKVNEDINSLSRGEKRRLAIASVLMSEPEILIVDEPATGQDYKGASEIMDLLTTLNSSGVTVLIITHDMRLVAEYTRRVIVMKEGKIVFDGTPERLFEDDALMGESSLAPPQLVRISRKLKDSGIINDILLNAKEWLELLRFESEKKKFEAMKFPDLKRYARELASMILSRYGRPDGIIYIERGGMVIGRLLSDFLSVRQVYPLKASYYNEEGIPMSHVHIGSFEYSLSENDGYLLLVDDIADTGKTLKAAMDELGKRTRKRIVTATLVYKPQSIFKPDVFVYTVDNNTWIVFDYEETETVTRFMRKGNREGLKFMKENFQ